MSAAPLCITSFLPLCAQPQQSGADAEGKRNATRLELLLSPEEIADGKRRAQGWLQQETSVDHSTSSHG
ncbi:MAG: hypothetical protein WCQ21_06090 [Verrucomicrobiota bacterium]|jgi:hypothetical protein